MKGAIGSGLIRPPKEIRIPARRYRIDGRCELFHETSTTVSNTSILDCGHEHLAKVVERRFLTDRNPAAYEIPGKRKVLQVGQKVRFSGTETRRHQHSLRAGRRSRRSRSLIEHIDEAGFRLRLIATQCAHCLAIGNAVTQSFHRPSRRKIRVVRRHVHRFPLQESLTSEATGLARFRSRTSFITRVRKAS